MSDKRQRNQLQMVLAFTSEGRSEAPTAQGKGPKRSRRNARAKARLSQSK